MKWEFWVEAANNGESSLFKAHERHPSFLVSNDEVPVPLTHIATFEAEDDLDKAKAELDRLFPTRHTRKSWKYFVSEDCALLSKEEIDDIIEGCDPGIRRVVRLLLENGFMTCDSGDGKTKVGTMGCALPYPNVFAEVDEDHDPMYEADRLLLLLAQNGVKFLDANSEDMPEGKEEEVPTVELNYNPVTKSAILAVLFVDDSMLPKE